MALFVTLMAEGNVQIRQEQHPINVDRDELTPFKLDLGAGRKVGALKVEIAKPEP